MVGAGIIVRFTCYSQHCFSAWRCFAVSVVCVALARSLHSSPSYVGTESHGYIQEEGFKALHSQLASL